MQAQLEQVQPIHGVDLGPECLCPPVCFQCPPPFCLPCGPGAGGAAPDNSSELVPPPRQCGPFMLLNTPMERKMVMLPMMKQKHSSDERERDHGHRHGGHHHKHHHDEDHKHVDCCDKPHHHHHGSESDPTCCDKPHHHHHHEGERFDDCKMQKNSRSRKDGDSRERRDGDRGDRRRDDRERHQRHRNESREHKDKRDKHHDDHDEREKKDGDVCETRRDRKRPATRAPRTNSRELRAGKLYIGCDCEKRNGLQDDCQRSLCQGSPECTTIPPTCAPSQFSNGKHLTKRRAEFEKNLREQFKNC